jgi:hypothetical protein
MEEKLPSHKILDNKLVPIFDALVNELCLKYELNPNECISLIRATASRWELEYIKLVEVARIKQILPGLSLKDVVALYESKLVYSVLIDKLTQQEDRHSQVFLKRLALISKIFTDQS